MKKLSCAFALLALLSIRLFGADEYRTVDALWAGYDPRALPVEPEVVKEEVTDGIVIRTVRYTSEVTDGFKVRAIAYYGFPVGAKHLPAITHMHGGGQNAMKEYISFWAKRGYAVLSIAWGGRPLEGKAENGKTEWGPLKYNQNGADTASVYGHKPDAKFNSWYHWTIMCRRGFTFLEQQPEVNPDRLGLFGISMGGQLTWMIAATDQRLKCAASVFGTALLYEPVAGNPGSEYQAAVRGDAVWAGALDPYAYAKQIKVPFLVFSATNDVHARLDMVDRALRQVPTPDTRSDFALHLSHRVTPAETPTLLQWMDRWLKDGPAWPRTPELALDLKRPDHVVVAWVTPQGAAEPAEVRINYSLDPFPAARFWRTVVATKGPDGWTAPLPVTALTRGLYVLATVRYASGLAISTRLGTVDAAALAAAHVAPSDSPSPVIDDFSHGIADWFNPDGGANIALFDKYYVIAGQTPSGAPGITWKESTKIGWRFFTYKIGDPKWHGPAGAGLKLTISSTQPNKIVAIASRFHSRPPHKEEFYYAEVSLAGHADETVTIPFVRFRSAETGAPLDNWNEMDLLGLASKYTISNKGTKRPDQVLGGDWQGSAAVLSRVEWVPSL